MGQITAVFLSYRRIDNFIILITSLIVTGIIYNLLRIFFNLSLLILFSLVIGICSGPFQSLHANIIRRCVRPEEVSSGMCLLHFAQGLSWTVVIAITGNLTMIRVNIFIFSYLKKNLLLMIWCSSRNSQDHMCLDFYIVLLYVICYYYMDITSQ